MGLRRQLGPTIETLCVTSLIRHIFGNHVSRIPHVDSPQTTQVAAFEKQGFDMIGDEDILCRLRAKEVRCI